MNSFMEQISKFSNLGEVITASQISVALILSFLLCLAAAKTYQITYRGVAFSPSFMHTLVICGMVIAAVMLIIGSNIARAFSLVGALSIIRFRNAVKDPRDVAYIFLSMGIGMATGTGFYMIAVILTIITCVAAILLSFFRFGEHGLSERLVRIQIPVTEGFEHLFDDVLKRHAESFGLISAETTHMGTEMELTYSLKVPRRFNLESFISDIKAKNDNLRIQVLGSANVLDL